MRKAPLLIDVSRLIWRMWAGRLPTGIDRVCLAYLAYFRGRARAVVQRKSRRCVLGAALSQRLFDLLLEGGSDFRRRLIWLFPRLVVDAIVAPSVRRQIFLNIGHTGLDEPSLGRWCARNGLRPVYLVHDLIPITHPEFCRAGEEQKHVRRMCHVLESAAGVITNSRATLDELMEFARRQALPMPPALVAWIAGLENLKVANPATMQRPYFVAVGTIEGRKNHVLLLKIWQRMVHSMGEAAPILLIVGQRGWEAGHAIEMLDHAPDLVHRVRELPRCEDSELARLIAGARALLMPSFAEGFGLPVIEALQLGTPVIASDLAALREIASGIPTFLDPLDGKAWEETIKQFADGSPERERQLTLMQEYRSPNWAVHFERVDRFLDGLA